MTESKPSPQTSPVPTSPPTPARVPREVASTDLFQGERSIVILHSGEHYRLMITRNDKLILQK